MHCRSQWSIYLGVGHAEISNPTLSHFHLAYKKPGFFTMSPQALHGSLFCPTPGHYIHGRGSGNNNLSSGGDLIKTFHHTHWVIGKACSLCRPASFQRIYQQAGTGVCVTLSCSQGFPLPSLHPRFTSGIGPVLHNLSQGDSKV